MSADSSGATGSQETRITNCHVHTFTAKHVPAQFLPFGLTAALRQDIVRAPLTFIGSQLERWFGFDQLRRAMRLVAVSNYKTQGEIFTQVRVYDSLNIDHPHRG